MARLYNEFNFNEDIELMKLTYQMNCGNFVDYEDVDMELLNRDEI